jgi:rRNA-processing protein FCF1
MDKGKLPSGIHLPKQGFALREQITERLSCEDFMGSALHDLLENTVQEMCTNDLALKESVHKVPTASASLTSISFDYKLGTIFPGM